MTSVPGFLTKTFEIFSSPEYSDCCGWGPNGDTIIIRKIEQFSKQVLPKYFKHSNFQSFVRQLNMYDFHKTVQDPSHGEFQHQYFKQGKPELLVYIKRKANNRASDAVKKYSHRHNHGNIQSAQSASTTSVSNIDELPDLELDALDAGYGSYHMDSYHPDSHYHDQMNGNGVNSYRNISEFEKKMEAKLNKVEEENRMLKKLFMESHQKNVYMQEKMDKVLKTLYTVFMGHPAGKALTSRMPSLLLTDGFGPPKALLTDDSTASSTTITELPSTEYPHNLERLNSLDMGSPLGAGYLSSGFAGSELTASTRGTSFDFAAASVSAPTGTLRYLPSFDSTYGDNNSNTSNNVPEGYIEVQNSSIHRPQESAHNGIYHSDRVTLLPDESTSSVDQANTTVRGSDQGPQIEVLPDESNHTTTPSASFLNFGDETQNGGWNLRRGSKRRSNGIYEDYVLPTSTPTVKASMMKKTRASFQDESASPTPADSSVDTAAAVGTAFDPNAGKGISAADLAQADTRQFIDLLNRNQNTTLNRLDSLEQTIATLLDSMDNYDANAPVVEPSVPQTAAAEGNHSIA